MEQEKRELCCAPGCRNAGDYARGQCCGCYFETRRSIKAGETSEKTVVRKGWMKPKKKPGPKSRSAMARALANPKSLDSK